MAKAFCRVLGAALGSRATVPVFFSVALSSLEFSSSISRFSALASSLDLRCSVSARDRDFLIFLAVSTRICFRVLKSRRREVTVGVLSFFIYIGTCPFSQSARLRFYFCYLGDSKDHKSPWQRRVHFTRSISLIALTSFAALALSRLGTLFTL